MAKNQQLNRWPADHVERRPLADLVPYAANARTHSAEQVEALAASITQWGWTIPVLVDERGEIIAGHGRVLAADKLGLETAPVMVAIGWTPEQVRAYRLADNKLSELAGWDDELLRAEFAELDGQFDVTLTGFHRDEIDSLFAPDNDALAEWTGMPEYVQHAKLAFKSLLVHFPDADAVQRFQETIGQAFTANTRFIWFPQQANERFKDKRYSAEEVAAE